MVSESIVDLGWLSWRWVILFWWRWLERWRQKLFAGKVTCSKVPELRRTCLRHLSHFDLKEVKRRMGFSINASKIRLWPLNEEAPLLRKIHICTKYLFSRLNPPLSQILHALYNYNGRENLLLSLQSKHIKAPPRQPRICTLSKHDVQMSISRRYVWRTYNQSPTIVSRHTWPLLWLWKEETISRKNWDGKMFWK